MTIGYIMKKWIRATKESLMSDRLDRERINQGYIVVHDPELFDRATDHIRKRFQPVQEPTMSPILAHSKL